MSDTEPSAFPTSSEPHLPEPLPLATGQRVAAGTVGTVLTAAGAASVFVAKNQVGSGALLFAGTVFLLIAVSGMPILGARFQEFELRLAWRRRQTALEVAARLPSDEGRKLLEIIDAADPDAYSDPLLTLIDSLLFEAQVRDSVIGALREGERIRSHPAAGIGEPLVEWVSAQGDTRVGVFAMFAPTETGKLSEPFVDRFVARVPQCGCDALILVSCVADAGDLAALASRVRQDTGLPVAIETWEPGGGDRQVRPTIDNLAVGIRVARAGLPQQARSPGDDATESNH